MFVSLKPGCPQVVAGSASVDGPAHLGPGLGREALGPLCNPGCPPCSLGPRGGALATPAPPRSPSPGGRFRARCLGSPKLCHIQPCCLPTGRRTRWEGPLREDWAVLGGQASRLCPGPSRPCPSPASSPCSVMPSPWGGGQRGAHRPGRWQEATATPRELGSANPLRPGEGLSQPAAGPPTSFPAGSCSLSHPRGLAHAGTGTGLLFHQWPAQGCLPARFGQPSLGPRGHSTSPPPPPRWAGRRAGSMRVGTLRSHFHQRLMAQMAETCRPQGPGY